MSNHFEDSGVARDPEAAPDVPGAPPTPPQAAGPGGSGPPTSPAAGEGWPRTSTRASPHQHRIRR